MKNDLKDAAAVSFITTTKIIELNKNSNDCQKASLQKVGNKLVWPVVAIFPEHEIAKALNKWRWGWVMKILDKCAKSAKVDLLIETQVNPEDEKNTKRRPFDIKTDVGSAQKLLVTSSIIKMNCSTRVDSDIDISFYGEDIVFVEIVKTVFLEMSEPSPDTVFSIDMDKCCPLGSIEMQKALAVMLDVEFFSNQHAFPGENAIVNDANQIVPVHSNETWKLSQQRLSALAKDPSIIPKFETVSYPKRDFHLADTRYFAKETSTETEDGEIELLMASDGYYTRPVFMYVSDTNSIAKSGTDLTNIEVVRNSFRSLMMVVSENLGFAMEYVDYEKHGICPTMKSRAQKISKYAERIAKALDDANDILKRHGLGSTNQFDTETWWKPAGKGRSEDKDLRDSFDLNLETEMKGMPKEMSNNELHTLLVVKIQGLLSEMTKNIGFLESLPAAVPVQEGGGDSARSWATMLFLGVLTLVASASPRPGTF